MDKDTDFGGCARARAPVGLRMERFPRKGIGNARRTLGHPVRLTGHNGKRWRVTSVPARQVLAVQ